MFTESDVASVLANYGLRVVQLGWRVLVAEQDLWRLLESSSRLAELLHEHFAENNVIFAFECRAEDDGDTVLERAHKQRLVVSVVDDGRLLARLTAFLELEVLLEDGGDAVALQHTSLVSELFPVFGQAGQIEEQGDTVAGLGRSLQIRAVLASNKLEAQVP